MLRICIRDVAKFDPLQSVGWVLSKLFIEDHFTEKLYQLMPEIHKTRVEEFADKFVSLLLVKFTEDGCATQLKSSTQCELFFYFIPVTLLIRQY